MRETRLESPNGRATVLVAALLGVSAVVTYAVSTTRVHPQATAPAAHAQQASLADLALDAATAREALDVDRLTRLSDELRRAAEGTTLAAKETSAELELIDVQAALALEASVRAEVDGSGRAAAQHAAGRSIAEVRALAVKLERKHADPGRVEAAMARAELAAGTDITDSFPAVLMPTYRDPELRLAALAAPIWRSDSLQGSTGEGPDQALVDEIVARLQAAERQTNLVRLLTAVALRRSDRAIDARGLVADVLQEVPQQPLARALQRALGNGQAVAVAAVVEPGVATPEPPSTEPTAADDGSDDEPIIERDPPRTPVSKPTVVEPPEPTAPSVDVEPTPAEPKPTVAAVEPGATTPAAEPKPAVPKPDAGTKKKGYDALLAEGCKLVRSGKASDGFELLKQAFDLNPTAVAVTVCMAEAHHELGRDASARALCDRALRKSPNDRRALLLAAELELARGNESAALAHYKKVLENNPDDTKAKAYVESHGG
jgi:tetratricopeptide (TPR) repeat protein